MLLSSISVMAAKAFLMVRRVLLVDKSCLLISQQLRQNQTRITFFHYKVSRCYRACFDFDPSSSPTCNFLCSNFCWHQYDQGLDCLRTLFAYHPKILQMYSIFCRTLRRCTSEQVFRQACRTCFSFAAKCCTAFCCSFRALVFFLP